MNFVHNNPHIMEATISQMKKGSVDQHHLDQPDLCSICYSDHPGNTIAPTHIDGHCGTWELTCLEIQV